MYGLEIRVENKYEKYIYKLLKNINVRDYIWQVNSDDIIIKTGPGQNQGLFNNDFVDGCTFFEIIQKHDYYLIFADFKAFRDKESVKRITTGKDMLESNCELVFLCTDSTDIEIYCKEKNIYDIVMLNCKYNGVVSFREIKSEKINSANLTAF